METKKEKIATQKIAILYFLEQAGVRIEEQRLTSACAALDLMDYFNLQTNLHDMVTNHLLERHDVLNGKFYSLTDVGATTLEFFLKELLLSTRNKIQAYCEEHGEEMRLEGSVFAEYVRVSDDQYRVILRLIENDVPVFEINFFATTRAEADRYVRAWRKNAMKVYSAAFESLLTEETV